MFEEILTTIAGFLILVLGVFVYTKSIRKSPPGPFQWPFIGNLPLLRKLSRQYGGQHLAFLELSRRYASKFVSLRLGRLNIIAVSGYNEIHKVLNTAEFDGRPWNEFVKLRNMGLKKGITMADGPEWKEIRAWFVRSLREVGFGRAEMAGHMHEELRLLLDSVKDGGVFRMQNLLAPAIINVIWTLATGDRMPNDTKLQEFIALMERRSAAFDMAGGILTIFPWIRHVAPEASGYNLLVTVNREIKDLLMETIEKHKKKYIPGGIGGDLINIFLEQMYSEQGERSIYDDDQLFTILLDVLIAGSVTTTATLNFLFLRMTVHQDVQRRLHEELDAVIGRDRLPEANDRPRLPYTEAVITESQRMHMTVPIIGPRRVMQDTYLDGYKIPKESCILVNLWSVHMNPEHFPDPESFKPERFIKNGQHVPDEKLILFGRGHRRCPGEAEARLAVFLFFARIMQRFQLLPKPGHDLPSLEASVGITMAPKPYDVLLVPRR